MMQIKPYKPQKMTKPMSGTLDDYREAAGIKPETNPLQPYVDIMNQTQAGGVSAPKPANYVGNSKPQSVAQMAAISSEGGIPEYMPGSGLSGMKTKTNASQGLYGQTNTKPSGYGYSGTLDDYAVAAGIKPQNTTKQTSAGTPPGSGTLDDYAVAAGIQPTSSKYTVSPQTQSGFDEYLAAANMSTRGTTTAPEEQYSETEEIPETARKTYDELTSWQKLFDELYGGDFESFDPSGLEGQERNLYDYYKLNYQAGLAEEERARAAQKNLEQKQFQQLQQAYINSELEKKYLPEYLKQIGMNGLGVSQSMLAQTQNNYQQNINDINNGISEETRSIFDEYAAVMRENAYKNQLGVNSIRDEQRKDEKVQQEQIKDLLYNIDEVFDNPTNYTRVNEKTTEKFLNADQYYAIKSEIEKNKEILGDRYDEYMSKLQDKSVYSIIEDTVKDLKAKFHTQTSDENGIRLALAQYRPILEDIIIKSGYDPEMIEYLFAE